MSKEPGPADTQRRFRVGEWRVAPMEGLLERASEQRRLQPRQMDVLVALARQAGDVIPREVLLRDLWGGRAMTDEPLTRCIAELRLQLEDPRLLALYAQTQLPDAGG